MLREQCRQTPVFVKYLSRNKKKLVYKGSKYLKTSSWAADHHTTEQNRTEQKAITTLSSPPRFHPAIQTQNKATDRPPAIHSYPNNNIKRSYPFSTNHTSTTYSTKLT